MRYYPAFDAKSGPDERYKRFLGSGRRHFAFAILAFACFGIITSLFVFLFA